ncbi:MAG TPA: hypothetical protein VIH75_23340 [Candidatus Sulfotelmatobacter sp.]|jgi:hypothetical protein
MVTLKFVSGADPIRLAAEDRAPGIASLWVLPIGSEIVLVNGDNGMPGRRGAVLITSKYP